MVIVVTVGGPLDGRRHTISDVEHSDGIWVSRSAEGYAEYRWDGAQRDDADRPVYRYVGAPTY